MDINLGGTFRAIGPKQTLSNIQSLVRRAGITRAVRLTHLDTIGIPVFTCIRPDSLNLTTSQGKGLTDELAMCSAYLEGIETFFAQNVKVDANRSHQHIPKHQCIDLSLLTQHYLSHKIDTDQINQWTRMNNILTQQKILVPTQYLNFLLTEPHLEHALWRKTTTGLASGNTYDEAVCHGIFEVIERDAHFEFNALRSSEKMKKAIDIESISYLPARKLIQHLREHHVNVAIFDMTHTFRLPTFSCLIADNSPFRNLGHYMGAGTHSDKGIALCRAITEAVQSRATFIAGSRDDLYPRHYQTAWQKLEIKGQANYENIPTYPLTTLQQQLSHLKTLLKAHQKDILIYEHTAPNDPISVIKCIIPGLAS